MQNQSHKAFENKYIFLDLKGTNLKYNQKIKITYFYGSIK